MPCIAFISMWECFHTLVFGVKVGTLGAGAWLPLGIVDTGHWIPIKCLSLSEAPEENKMITNSNKTWKSFDILNQFDIISCSFGGVRDLCV